MAAPKELCAVVVDVGAGMGPHLPAIRSELLEFAVKKSLWSLPHRGALILVGSHETNNQMAMEEDDGESFQNIAVEFAMNFPRADFITTADKIAGKAGPDGDVIEALFVAVKSLRESLDELNQKDKDTAVAKVVLVSCCSQEPAIAAEHLNEYLLGIKNLCLKESQPKIALSISVVGPQPNADMVSALEQLVLMIGEESGKATIKRASSAVDFMSLPPVKPVKPSTVSRQPLYLCDQPLKVWVFKKAHSAKIETLKIFSQEKDPAARTDADQNTAKRSTEYVSKENEGQTIASTMDAFAYGQDLIPVGTYAEERLRWIAGPFLEESHQKGGFQGMLLLGTVARAKVPRHSFCGEAEVVVPVPPKAVATWKSGGASDVVSDANARAVSAFARALHKKDSLAVVRGIYRNSKVWIGVLSPVLGSAESGLGDHLLLNTIPFEDDLRSLAFDRLPLTPGAAAPAPSAEQADAAAALVRGVRLAPGFSTDQLRNPHLRRFYRALGERAAAQLNAPPDAPRPVASELPGPEPFELCPPLADSEAAAAAVMEWERSCPTRAAPPRARRRVAGSATDADDGTAADAGGGGGGHDGSAISSTAPDADFLKLMQAAGGNIDGQIRAMRALDKALTEMLPDLDRWPIVLAALVVLRSESVKLGFPGIFNGLHDKIFVESCGVADGGLWALLQQQGVAKINAADALPATSADVPSEEEAKRDLARDAAAEAPRADLDADTQLEADPDMDMDDGGGGGGGAAADDFDDMD